MTERHASRTALLVAAYRARASRRDDAIISDPWAAGLAGAEGEAIAAKVDAFLLERELWIAVRTAYLDEHVARWIRAHESDATKPTQVVVLGAGFDARAARFAKTGVRFFEVDQPATQQEKLAAVRKLAGYPASAATYVACDFEKDDFLDRLQSSGFDPAVAALVLWEGVTPYLHEPAIRSTLRRVATGCEPRTVLLFDHFTRSFVEGATRSGGDQQARDLVEELGERFVFGTNDPVPMLFEEGFRHVRSVSFDEACLSVTGTYRRERQFRFQRIVLASRTAPPRLAAPTRS
ncbi:MAG: O-Methyltransferase involved in polyketide biosynthesis [Labilithrix sp.]|nr:O-Methyltransferase involved in polyketide biosynthesis [Labilithrix sp.]